MIMSCYTKLSKLYLQFNKIIQLIMFTLIIIIINQVIRLP